MYHPWRALRALGDGVRLVWTPLAPGVLALTDGHARIWIDPDQDQATRRCTIAHELAHIELGHIGGCAPREDRDADELAARRLIPLERLADTLAWTESAEEAADELWVDEATLAARIECLTDAERAALDERVARVERPA